jgi:hypothetical protein
MKKLAALLILLLSCSCIGMENVRVAPDNSGFVLVESGKRFIPWGFNYGHNDQLLEDFWDSDWHSIERDFDYMHSLGANVVRVHMQVAKFMDGPEKPNVKSLDRLGQLLKLAERKNLYLDLTGLACYRTADVPAWYDPLSEHDRWAVQARFWEAIAERFKGSPAVFCYDLMNEPVVPGGRREAGKWYSGKPFGGFDFVQFITIDQGNRPREVIASQWIKTLTKAIRKHDERHMITVGLLPWVKGWGFLSGFVPERVAPDVDFIAVHIYPEAGKPDEAITMLKKFSVGKPVVVEETFPLTCSVDDLRKFLLDSRPIASGWIGHYSGETIDDLTRRDATQPARIDLWLAWLKLFRDMTPQMQDGLKTGN